jgi:lysophospholipid acyltransferase (LPLAT)-like uncharacterized protein
MPFWKKIIRTSAAVNVMAVVAYLWVRFVQATSRTEYRGVEKLGERLGGGRPAIVVFWHSRGLFMTKVWREKIGMKRHPICGIFSTHADGRLIGKVYSLSGVGNILTSSKSIEKARDVAFKSIRLLRGGVSIGFTPDGPLGPAMKFNTESVFLFAKSSGAPIVPLYISADRARFLNTWDRYMLIKPFSRSVIEVGDPVDVPRVISREAMGRLKSRLEKTMREKTRALDREMGIEAGKKPGKFRRPAGSRRAR